MDEDLPRAFVCGYPVTHSRSPLIHNYWLRSYAIAGSYQRCEVKPENFGEFIESLRGNGYIGGNVTVPHKEAACALLHRKDESVEMIGAANTLWLEEGQLCGSNTDGYGFAANLDERAPGWADGKTATVLGAGGAARAVVYALQQRGYRDIRIVNRTVKRAQELCDHFGGGTKARSWDALPELLMDSKLLVNTTSLGMNGEQSYCVDLDGLPSDAVVTDIVYVPLRTPLLEAAAARGLRTVDGLGMLLHQAVPGFERWFGRRPEVTKELHDIIIADIEGVH
jgi:shikimate dehydrogenase